MKKENNKFDLLIVMAIAFGIFIILSYIIPVGYYSSSTYVGGQTEPVGIVGLFKTPLYSVAIFVQYLVVFLVIGGLYSVMSKTGVYNKVIDSVVKKFDNKRTLFLVISVISFGLLTSLSGLPLVLFTLVPFVSTIILLLGFDKITALASTIGAMLIGLMGSTYGNASIFANFFSIDANKTILFKFIILAVLLFLLIMYILRKNSKQQYIVTKPKKTKKNETTQQVVIEAPFYENQEKNKKSFLPLVIILISAVVISLIGMFNWYYAFGTEFFINISALISEIKIGNIAIFSQILGTFTEIGQWGNYEFATLLLFVTVIIAWVYSIKPSEAINAYYEGIKKMLKPAIYVALACVIFAIMVNGSNGNVSTTITNFILGLSEKFNVLLVSLSGILGSFFHNDFPYLLSGMYGAIGVYEEAILPVAGIILQASYGLVMLVLPVSVILVAGLKLLNVSYKEWFKYIWKLLLQLFMMVIIFGLILSMIV